MTMNGDGSASEASAALAERTTDRTQPSNDAEGFGGKPILV